MDNQNQPKNWFSGLISNFSWILQIHHASIYNLFDILLNHGYVPPEGPPEENTENNNQCSTNNIDNPNIEIKEVTENQTERNNDNVEIECPGTCSGSCIFKISRVSHCFKKAYEEYKYRKNNYRSSHWKHYSIHKCSVITRWAEQEVYKVIRWY